MKANIDIRREAKRAGVAHWQIAKRLGCAESTFCKKLRDELSPEDKTKVRQAIIEIGETEQGGGSNGNMREAFGA